MYRFSNTDTQRGRWRSVAIVSLLVALFAPFATAPPAAAASVNESEPNDSIATANVLAAGDTLTGSSFSTSAQDYDYFAVDLPKAGRLKLTFKFPANLGTGTAYAVSIYNTSGKSLYHFLLKGEHANGTWLADQGTFAPAGRLYIRIHGYSSWPTWGKTYTLNAALTPGNVETESNDSTSTADTLSLGTTISGSSLSTSAQDNDYYAVTVPKKQKVRIGLSFPAKLGTGNAYVLNVYDPSGKQLAYAIVMASQHNFATTLTLPAGRAHVRVYGYTSWVTWGNTYQLGALKTLTKTPQPKISGTAKVGSKLTAKPGTWAPAPVKLSYQWLRNGKAIPKATQSTYKLAKADSRKKISVKVTGSKTGHQSVATTSKTLTIK